MVLVLSFFMFYSHRQKVLSTMKMDFVNSMTHEMKTPIYFVGFANDERPVGGKYGGEDAAICRVITNESKTRIR